MLNERHIERLRSAWILFRRGELGRKKLVGAFWACLSEPWGRSAWAPRSPRLVLVAATMALAVIGILSHGFSATRALFRPLPVPDTARLVAIRYTGSVGQPAGVPPRLLPGWRENAKLLSGLAAYWHRPYAPSASVTPNFFSVLGTHAALGRLFQPEDRGVAVLSDTYWRTSFDADPEILGRRVTVDDNAYTVVGVLPKGLWAISPRILVWTPLQLGPRPDPGVPVLIPVIGKLKPGVSPEALRTDLFNASRSAHQFVPRRPEVVAFTGAPGRLLPWYLLGITFAIAVAGVIIAKQQGVRFHGSAKYKRFLLGKTLLLVAIPALAWIESPLTGVVSAILFLAGCSLAFWWSFADQRQRCPECLERLAMPVTIGSWSSVLEPVRTEFLCKAGHGSLDVPETDQGEPDRWRTLDPSWRELFESVPPEKQ